jgi:hypothetical protein
MSDFLEKLDKHREIMSDHGYDEIGLGSPDEPGHYMKQLEFFFSSCVAESRFHSQTKKDFFIEAFGFFNQNTDLVIFKFHYEFDPAVKDIELKSFIARMDSLQRPYLLGRNMNELPQAKHVYQALFNERQLQVAKQIINRDENISQNRNHLKI